MKHLLKLLLLVAVALPFGSSAQEVKPEQTRSPRKAQILETKNASAMKKGDAVLRDRAATMRKAPAKAPETNANSITVLDGYTGTNAYIPVYGWYYDMTNCTSQMIYPTSLLEGLYVGDEITKLTFYTDDNGIKFSGGQLTITIGETTTNVFSSNALMSLPTTTVSGTVVPTNGAKTLSVVFSTPLEYTGNNLFVQVVNTTKGTCDPSSSDNTLWIGRTNIQNTSGNAYYASYCNKGNTGRQAFLPTVTIEKYVDISNVEARDITLKDEAFFSSKSYTWTDSEGTHTSYLNEPATKPEQMIAMLRKVYMDPEIPGNLKRGFASNGTDVGETNQAVYYSGVGGVKRTGSYVDVADSYEYDDKYGWGITGNINEIKESSYLAWHNSSSPYVDYLAYYASLDQEQYKPEKEGLTLLLVELKDTYEDGSNNTIGSATYDSEYDRLKAYFANTVKSIRVVTEAKRTGEGVQAGTLFKIDCDKMNKFFLLAKGQLHLDHNSYYYTEYNASDIFTSGSEQHYSNWDFAPEPGYIYYYKNTYSSYNNWDNSTNPTWGGIGGLFCDDNTGPLFYHMFEQFSPSMPSDEQGADDLYQNMVNMESFPVVHDCLGITIMNHQFLMYGADSQDADCQDVRDLMFFVPDYRMLKDDGRDPGEYVQQYLNYNTAHQPKMALFVIKQYPITGEQITGQDTYKLHLTWTSNLLNFLPGEDGQYTLYRVITNEDGTKTYQAVGEFNPNTLEYYDDVPMQQTSQQVTYVVQGQDAGKFLTLQMSNEESYIVPGLDPSEIVLLEDAAHYSRFDAQRVRNCYSNKLTMKNNAGGIKQANLTAETQLTITRIPQGGNVDPAEIATVTFNPSNMTYTVQMADQAADETEFPLCVDGSYAGYHANNGTVKGNGSWTGNYTVNANGDINLGTLEIFDNFVQEIPDNNYHPIGYVYQVTSNYECAGTSVYLNAAACTTGDEVWYAWTWNNDNDGKWVQGIVVDKNVLKFVPVKNNIIFARLDPTASNVPSWEARWNQTGNLSTQGYIGKTFTASWGNDDAINGSWGSDVIADMAHSNTFRVPIYKTASQINGSFTQAEVDGETGNNPALGIDENVEFGVGIQLSSKSEILRYDTYRWNENDPRYIIAWADGDDEQDLPPTGQAMNQGEYYTISMNPGTDNETNGSESVADGSGTATFVDEIPTSSTTAVAYTYAPVVEAFSGRGDYNTYGGPLQNTAVGKFNTIVSDYEHATYSWEVDGKEYCYYNVFLQFNNAQVPSSDYELYKVRVWRQMETALLGEEQADYAYRMGDEIGGGMSSYLFEEITYGDEGIPCYIGTDTENVGILGHVLGKEVVGSFGSHTNNVARGTFGARQVGGEKGVASLPMKFIVRSYFTKKNNLPATAQPAGAKAPMRAGEGDGKFYIVQQEIPYEITSSIITGISDVNAGKQVSGVMYYDMTGKVMPNPQGGVYIEVTRYSDGSTSTRKVVK